MVCIRCLIENTCIGWGIKEVQSIFLFRLWLSIHVHPSEEIHKIIGLRLWLLLFLWSCTPASKVEIEFSIILLLSFWLNDISAKIKIVELVSLNRVIVSAELLKATAKVELIVVLDWRYILWLGL